MSSRKNPMQRLIIMCVISLVILTSACSPVVISPKATIPISATGTTAPPISTPSPETNLVGTVVPTVATITCAVEISWGDGKTSYFQILTGILTPGRTCDSMIENAQLIFNPGDFKVVRVYSYPTSPIICSNTFGTGATITIVDTNNPPTDYAVNLCQRMASITTPESDEPLTCAVKISGPEWAFYQIHTGVIWTDDRCNRMIQTILATITKVGQPLPVVEIVSEYPTMPVVCSKTYSTGGTITIVDLQSPPSGVALNFCASLP